jgi:HTH-type transcriptional regulator/antitoxin HipB
MADFVRTPKQLGDALRRRRRAQNLTQAELGERAGLRQATISALEAGAGTARLETLFDALGALGAEIIVKDRRKFTPGENA